MAEKRKAEATTTDTPTEKPNDPLDVYLQYTQEGDPDADTPAKQWWVAALTQGGHTTGLYGKSKEEVQERAKELLAAHGVEI
jgi:hypothetical protein